MKPAYYIFSKNKALLAMAATMLAATAHISYAILKLLPELNYHAQVSMAGCVTLLVAMDIWMLSYTVFPIIRIDKQGIKAYSFFWRRKIKWEEVADFQLTKVIYTQDDYTDRQVLVQYVHTKIPETKTQCGLHVQTFIVVSKSAVTTPPYKQLYIFYHKDIAAKDSIAFEYSGKAYDAIKANVPITLYTHS